MVEALRRELIGPSPIGEALDCSQVLKFDDWQQAVGPYVQADTGEEIIIGDRPGRRYGIGVLYPTQTPLEGGEEDLPGEEESLEESAETEDSAETVADLTVLGLHERDDEPGHDPAFESDDDFPLSNANSYRPSSIGVSFRVDLSSGSDLVVEFSAGRYVAKEVLVKQEDGSERPLVLWLREPVRCTVRFSTEALSNGKGLINATSVSETTVPKEIDLEIAAVTRPRDDGTSLVTLSAINRTKLGRGGPDPKSLFQVEMKASVEGAAAILPYEELTIDETRDREPELASLALLYRDSPAFGVGHGCSADWEQADVPRLAREIRAECLPEAQTPSITPDIQDPETGESISVPMAPLAGLEPWNGPDGLRRLIASYSAWIDDRRDQLPNLDEGFRETAQEHLDLCGEARDRMLEGLEFLASDKDAAKAFAFANEAMLLQQGRSSHPTRVTKFDWEEERIRVEGELELPDGASWRPFQIAFVLCALKSTALGEDGDRDLVELLFFPTGGGKTEAYLALAAFSIFLRRIRDQEDVGVDVLMRYTLRLLTAQQFQRAASLMCAMEQIRTREVDTLGEHEFSVGVWLGGGATPNSRKDAVAKLKKLEQSRGVENPFILLKCPWCSAQMGPIDQVGKKPRGQVAPRVAGYEQRGKSVALRCPDHMCDFHERSLPVYVIDDDVYEKTPSLVIGTVDKFAMLAFRPEARGLFGLGAEGERVHSPPNLVIQDELHLISGPLGSMVGLYEALIEELSTDHRSGVAVRPKLVGSTATIRRYQQQIVNLYGRSRSALFPPRGLDAGDSFFAKYALKPDGTPEPGRLYVGIHGPGLGSIQTAQVRTFACVLQAAALLPEEQRDPWWTLLAFFNSLRELGTSLSLLQSDIRDYLRVIQKRLGFGDDEVRRVFKELELTGRLRNDEVPQAILDLERRYGSAVNPVDVCLASNIVEVGIDVPRLSLMAVVGQPKTTSQYIQATGRVGRDWRTRPGLVATIYSASKPRDRSHYEKFRAYHERLYSQVEPTSVTPFAPPVLERALHAVLVAYVRQFGSLDIGPEPVPDELISAAHDLLAARVREVDPAEAGRFEETFKARLGEWKRWGRLDWSSSSNDDDIPLLRYAGEYADRTTQKLSWEVPTSMRNVDAECRATVTRSYAIEADGE